jgi:uncharacterized protein YbaP (TraB family)
VCYFLDLFFKYRDYWVTFRSNTTEIQILKFIGMNRLNLLQFLASFLLLSILVSCGEKSEMPVWEITKSKAPKSYLVGTIKHLKTKGNETIITQRVSELFDSSSTYITEIDIIGSDLLLSKNEIEIGMNRTLKEILSEENFTTLSKLKNQWSKTNNNTFQSPDSARIKLLFYLQDILYQNDGENIYFEYLWLKQAMATQKSITGLESFQKHYQDLSQVTLAEQIEFMESIGDIKEFKKEFSSIVTNSYFEGEYKNIYDAHLEKFTYNKSNHGTLWKQKHENWANTIDSFLSKEKCFISIDVQHLFGKENFFDYLFLKGYKIEKIQ